MAVWSVGTSRFRAAAIVALALFGCAGSPAHAVPTYSFDLTSDHCSGAHGCLNGASGGTVTVSEPAADTLHFLIEPATNIGILNTGAGASFAFNLNGNPTITFSSLTSGFIVLESNPAHAGIIHTGGAGNFEYGVSCNPPSGACGNGGSSPYFGTLSFDITAPGLTLATVEQNGGGNYFSMDVLGTTGKTGVIDAHSFTDITPTPTIPEPGTLVLLGGALAGFAILRRRKRG